MLCYNVFVVLFCYLNIITKQIKAASSDGRDLTPVLTGPVASERQGTASNMHLKRQI